MKNFHEFYFWELSVKIHICDIKNLQLKHDLNKYTYISKPQRDVANFMEITPLQGSAVAQW